MTGQPEPVPSGRSSPAPNGSETDARAGRPDSSRNRWLYSRDVWTDARACGAFRPPLPGLSARHGPAGSGRLCRRRGQPFAADRLTGPPVADGHPQNGRHRPDVPRPPAPGRDCAPVRSMRITGTPDSRPGRPAGLSCQRHEMQTAFASPKSSDFPLCPKGHGKSASACQGIRFKDPWHETSAPSGTAGSRPPAASVPSCASGGHRDFAPSGHVPVARAHGTARGPLERTRFHPANRWTAARERAAGRMILSRDIRRPRGLRPVARGSRSGGRSGPGSLSAPDPPRTDGGGARAAHLSLSRSLSRRSFASFRRTTG